MSHLFKMGFAAAIRPSNLQINSYLRMCYYEMRNHFSKKITKNSMDIPKNPLTEFNSAATQTEKGSIYDKKPFRLELEPGKKYAWCACGKSKSQPICDGTHKSPFLKIKLRPIIFQVSEKKEYWLCNCKQTAHRPYCDGTHKREDIQEAIKS